MNLPPQKPWEGGGNRMESSNMNNVGRLTIQNIPSTSSLNSSAPLGSIRTTGPPPPLPPRPSNIQQPVQRIRGTSTYGYGGGYGMSPYSSYGNYGGINHFGYGGYGVSGVGYGYGRPLHPLNDVENRFIQMAEENSRPAFQSIESVVQAFSSVSMMLESTFHAMYSSFRAIIGVAENFSRLRLLFTQFFSAIAILKYAQNFLRRLLYWFGVIKEDPTREMLWQSAQESVASGAVATATPRRSAWPVFTFLGLLFGGPYLMSKLLGEPITENVWNPQEEPGPNVVAIHSFQAGSSNELSFQRGQKLQMAPPKYNSQTTSPGWVLAANQDGEMGYVPANRIARYVTKKRVSTVENKQSNVIEPVPAPVNDTEKGELPIDQEKSS